MPWQVFTRVGGRRREMRASGDGVWRGKESDGRIQRMQTGQAWMSRGGLLQESDGAADVINSVALWPGRETLAWKVPCFRTVSKDKI